uniref:Uncharacterized protein n=1 Tax=Panagrellus redivivus TaxID=6233 RepID=A0A7E4ZYL3_PANRE
MSPSCYPPFKPLTISHYSAKVSHTRSRPFRVVVVVRCPHSSSSLPQNAKCFLSPTTRHAAAQGRPCFLVHSTQPTVDASRGVVLFVDLVASIVQAPKQSANHNPILYCYQSSHRFLRLLLLSICYNYYTTLFIRIEVHILVC